MDKSAYHLNKEKQPAKTEGKVLYYYPCGEEDNPDFGTIKRRISSSKSASRNGKLCSN